MRTNDKCKTCTFCKTVAATEVTGDDHAIKREFERIEHAERRSLHIINAQAKAPSATTDRA